MIKTRQDLYEEHIKDYYNHAKEQLSLEAFGKRSGALYILVDDIDTYLNSYKKGDK